MIRFAGILALALSWSPFVAAQGANPELALTRPIALEGESHLHLAYESRYVSEGRDNLDGADLFTTTIDFGRDHLAFALWYADSPEIAYNELHLILALTHEWEDLAGYVNVNHLRFPNDETHDTEIGAGVEWSGLPYRLAVTLDAYYSIRSEGAFIELACSGEYEVAEKVTVIPALVFGMNQGYIDDGHDGANHLTASLGIRYALTETLSLTGHVAFSQAIDRSRREPGDDLLRDFCHYGVGLSATF